MTPTINSFRESAVQTSSESYSSNRIQHNRDTAVLPVALTGLNNLRKGTNDLRCVRGQTKYIASNTIFLNFAPTLYLYQDVVKPT